MELIPKNLLVYLKKWYPVTARYLLKNIWQGGTREIGPEDTYNIKIPSLVLFIDLIKLIKSIACW